MNWDKQHNRFEYHNEKRLQRWINMNLKKKMNMYYYYNTWIYVIILPFEITNTAYTLSVGIFLSGFSVLCINWLRIIFIKFYTRVVRSGKIYQIDAYEFQDPQINVNTNLEVKY